VKQTLAITAGCLIAALTVGDTVYRISPRPGRTYSDVVAVSGNLGDISQLTDQDEDQMKGMDDLFAQGAKDGIDADELASIRELAAIAKPWDSNWGEEFFKNADGKVGGCSPYVLGSVSGSWDSTLGCSMANSATSGPLSYFAFGGGGGAGGMVDQFSMGGGGGGSGRSYGGGGGGGGGGNGNSYEKPIIIVSSLSHEPVAFVPEPTTASALLFGAAGLLARRRRRA